MVGLMMAQVALLDYRDQVRVDTGCLEEILSELGASAAHRVLDSAIEQLSASLSGGERSIQSDDDASVVAAADRIARVGWAFGLVTLSAVALDMVRVTALRDAHAREAVRARLMRVGRSSLAVLLEEAAMG